MKYLSAALVIVTSAGLGACDQKQAETSADTQTETAIQPIEIKNVAGQVRNTQFVLEQAIIDNGRLILRQGKEFFADVAVEVVTFDNGDLAGKSFDAKGTSNPHIELGVKKEGESLPDTLFIMSGYELILTFGKKEELGIPFSIRLISTENGTNIKGNAFATFGDFKVLATDKGRAIDLQYDSFDTLELLAKKHIDVNV